MADSASAAAAGMARMSDDFRVLADVVCFYRWGSPSTATWEVLFAASDLKSRRRRARRATEHETRLVYSWAAVAVACLLLVLYLVASMVGGMAP